MTRELSITRAVESIRAIYADEAKAIEEATEKAVGAVRRRHAKLRNTVLSKVHEKARELVLSEAREGEETAPIGGFGTDPADFELLIAILALVDTEFGWPSPEVEEAGDYLGRLREIARFRDALAAAWRFQPPGKEPSAQLRSLLNEVTREVSEKTKGDG